MKDTKRLWKLINKMDTLCDETHNGIRLSDDNDPEREKIAKLEKKIAKALMELRELEFELIDLLPPIDFEKTGEEE